MKNRIKELRLQQGKSLAALESLTGMSAQQINRLEKGERRLNEDGMRALATALQCRPQDLLAANDKKVPVIGEVGAGGQVFPVDDMPLISRSVEEAVRDSINCEFVEAPPGEYPDGLVALRVTGNSQMPFMAPGTIVYYSMRFLGGAPDECIGKMCVVQVREGATMLKILRRGQIPDRFDLVSYNMESIENVDLAWCARVSFIKPT